MTTARPQIKKAVCKKHSIEVIISIPADKLGNAHGQEWYCRKCKGSPRKIIIN